MDAFFLDPQVARLPPEETRILDLRAEPYSDGKRVHVNLELTPFLQRPEIELTLTDPTVQTCASANVIEPAGRKLELTLHIRSLSGAEGRASQVARDTSHSARGTFTLAAHLTYPDLGEIDHREATIELPPPHMINLTDKNLTAKTPGTRSAINFFLRDLRVFPVYVFIASLFLSACAPNSEPRPTATLPPPTVTATTTPSPSPTLTLTPAPSQTPYVITATSAVTPSPRGLFIFSLNEAGYAHLFIYSPLSLTLTRLTAGRWDDITASLSPDGERVAFASRRNGYWDLYLLELGTGDLTRLTDSLEYDACPAWSPDSQWLAYESYVNDNLEIFIRSATDPSQAPIRLTENSAADHSPAWSPKGRQIAFVSNRSGEDEVWIADLDRLGEERFVNVSRDPQSSQARPAWSPDGERLAWATSDANSGLSSIYVWDSRQPAFAPRWAGSGDWPVWEEDDHLAVRLTTANQNYLTAYAASSGELSLPPMLLPGALRGISYGMATLPNPLPAGIQGAAASTPAALYQPAFSPQDGIPAGRAAPVPLQGIQAPFPQLHDMVDESFQALRQRLIAEAGWDALADLENAYVPLTTPPDPGLSQDWLYTGRAFSFNPALVNAGWISVVREDFGQQTYWRIFLRVRAQDGSQGEPLHQTPWDFSTRYDGNPAAFEQGGSLMSAIPQGYWLDFTSLALQYGWERLPALSNWRTYFNGARFNEFAMRQGLTWQEAMLELYPPEALTTPTAVIPPTRTPTRTPWGYKPPTPTHTPTPQPTFTPSP